MAKDRNVAAVDDFEAIMKPEVRLGKGMVGRTQASAMAMLKAGESLTVTEYMDAILHGSEKGEGNVNTELYTSVPSVSFGQSNDERRRMMLRLRRS